MRYLLVLILTAVLSSPFGMTSGNRNGSLRRKDGQGKKCSNSDLIGAFGFALGGQHIGLGSYSILGSFDSDGRGNLKGAGYQSANGVQHDVTFVGNYAVQENCTGQAELKFESGQVGEIRFVLVSDQTEALLMDSGGHTAEIGYAKKQFTSPRKPD